MIYIACQTCKHRRRCPSEPDQRRDSLFAWANKRQAPECPRYEPRYHHGIDGVYADPSPRPSRQRGTTSIHHGDRACSR